MSVASRWRRVVVTTSMMALLGLTVSATGIAQADEFTTGNTAPTVATPALSPTIQPDAGASAAEYTYSVVVGDADTLNDLETVTVCLYLTAGGDSTCATPDPATDVEMTWTQSTNAFTIDDGSDNAFWALGVSTGPTLTETSGTYTFNFTVSEAMREGNWTAKVTAHDGDVLVDAVNSAVTASVLHYSAITSRVAQDFGTVNPGLANGVVSTATPTVASNGQTTYSATAGNFSDGTYTFTLKSDGITSIAPAAGQVTFDCQVAASFTEASAFRVGATSTLLSATETGTGTVEGGTQVANSCRLAHGGGNPVSDYTAIVVNAIGNG